MNRLCTICARGGSKGVPNKNIKKLNEKPLIAHSIEQAKASGLFEYIVISTDSDEIAEVSRSYGADVFFKRTDELSSDTAGKLDVIKDAFQRSESHFNQKFDQLVDLDATSPLRNPQDIISAISILEKENSENLFSVMPSRRSPYFNLVEKTKEGKVQLSKPLPHQIVRRQDSPKTYDVNASIYIWTRSSILNSVSLFGDHTSIYIMPEERSIDIDSASDFIMVEALMKYQLK